MHDAILIGIGTALNDDPQLNSEHTPQTVFLSTHNNSSLARHLPPPPEGTRHHLPRPVIIDTHLRLSPTCKLLRNYQAGQGRRPWILCVGEESAERRQRLDALEKAGATVIQVPAFEQGERHHERQASLPKPHRPSRE